MKKTIDRYESVIGLEIHVQLNTLSKAYSSDANEYGAMPNTRVSAISLGHPGTLPMSNEKVIEYAVRLGIACNCKIRELNEYARKNYIYPDLPRGYQITQHAAPICNGGYLIINNAEGSPKKIGLTRIHMEEDSGKSIHNIDPFNSLIDLNRAGIPLLEIVSEPDFRNGQEAYNYLIEMRKIVRYLEISDGNMEEGSLRCDVNVSVRSKGDKKLGIKVEIKNLNSFRNVQKAIDYEIIRQLELMENGKTVEQETRTFDPVKRKTHLLRTKEDTHDYRYFTEPDLQPIRITKEYIESIKKEFPPLPSELFEKYRKLGLSEYDAHLLTDTKGIALYFEDLISHTDNYKAAANWIMGPIKSYLNDGAMIIEKFPISPATIATLIKIVDDGQLSHSAATGDLFSFLLQNPKFDPLQIAREKNLIQESDKDILQNIVEQAIAKFPDKVEEYRNGKKGLLGLFMGEVMNLSRGKANPKVANKLVRDYLENK